MLMPLACPRCGNTTAQKGLTYCALEWLIVPVVGMVPDALLLDYERGEHADVDDKASTTMTNTPNATGDLPHLHCNACDWAWFDPRLLNPEDAHLVAGSGSITVTEKS